MDWLTALLLALIVVLAHLLLDEDGGDGGKFSRARRSLRHSVHPASVRSLMNPLVSWNYPTWFRIRFLKA